MMSLRTITYGKNETLIAACDIELLGKKFLQGDLKLEVKEAFFKGDVMSIDALDEKIPKADIVNLVGERVVNKAIELGYVKNSNVVKIQEVPHVQIVNM